MSTARNIVTPEASTILQVQYETEREVTFRVATDITVNHGQFLQLSLPKIGEVPISVSAFGPGWLEFTIRAVGRVTDKLFAMQPGDTMFIRGGYGNGWPMDELKQKNLVVISGGTGLAPVRSLLHHAAENPSTYASVHLIAGFRDQANVLFHKELEAWRTAFHTCYTLDSEVVEGFHQGFVTAHVASIPFIDFANNYAVLVVGPPMMMHHTAKALVAAGVPEEAIWLSFERKMSCAVGKCGHCRIDEVYVCMDGPVFNYTVAKNLID